MSKRVLTLVLVFCMLMPILSHGALKKARLDDSGTDSILHIHLPRQVITANSILELGQISIIRGEKPLVDSASKIALGRFSIPGQKIVVNRQTILSRLACSEVPFSDVVFTGAQDVTVRRQQQVIKGSEFVELANSYLEKNLPVSSISQTEPIRIPKDMILPWPSADVELMPNFDKNLAGNQAKVQVDVFVNGQKIGAREVVFRLKYNSRRAVALIDIPQDTILTSENIKIEKVLSDYPEQTPWSLPYGSIAKRQLPAGTVIRPDMIGSVKPNIVVGRNETVVIRFERPGLLVTAVGKSMQQARVGEFVKVRNMDSQRVILCKVNEDGTVEPVL
jgi:flagella basal body P-ring formation protein FlgA